MNENIMTQFKAEGEPAFPTVESKENDNSSDSSTGEKTSDDQTQSDGGDQKPDEKKDGDTKNENFADHPRWKEREQDWTKRFNEQETRHTQEIEQIRKDIEAKFDKKREAIEDSEIPAWFGGDADAWSQYQAHEKAKLDALEERAIEKAQAKISEKSEKEQNAIKEATEYFNTTVAELEADKTLNPDGSKIDRNKLLKIVLDNDLVDSKGRWNYKVGFQMMKNSPSTKNNSIDEKKKVAGATTSENKGETKSTSFSTSEDFKKPGARPW